MLRLVYGTDFHGSVRHYDDILNFALEQNIKIIHLGSDILPKGYDILKRQKKFINSYLQDFYLKCSKNDIKVMAFFGNDDIYSRKKYFNKFASLLDENPVEIDGYEFKAYGYVQDYPFSLKTACKLDYNNWVFPEKYLGPPVDIDPYTGELQKIEENIADYFIRKGTIENDLKTIRVSDKTIMAIHQPPYSINLDVCQGGRRVGSKAVYDWIKTEQPKLVLCGHIHESYSITGVWKEYIDKTLVLQPGQRENASVFSLVEISDDTITAQMVIKPH